MDDNRIDKLTPKLGQFIRVNNAERFDALKGSFQSKDKFKLPRYRESTFYVSLQVEDVDGNGERCLLFTPTEHTDMEFIELDPTLTRFVTGRLYPAVIGRKPCYLIKTKHWDGRARILRISKSQLAKADRRAMSHPKTITTKPAIVDMFD